MLPNVTEITQVSAAQKTKAAYLLAADDLADWQIAEEVGISRMQLSRWKHEPEFAQMVEDATARLVDRRQVIELRYAIARLGQRIARMNKRWEALQKIIEERAADPEMQKVPGGSTGLLVKAVTKDGVSYRVDSALLRGLLELEKEAAIQMGQRARPQPPAEQPPAPPRVTNNNTQINVNLDADGWKQHLASLPHAQMVEALQAIMENRPLPAHLLPGYQPETVEGEAHQ